MTDTNDAKNFLDSELVKERLDNLELRMAQIERLIEAVTVSMVSKPRKENGYEPI